MKSEQYRSESITNVRDSLDNLHLIEWKADRASIGGHGTGRKFTDHVIRLRSDDVLVMMSDGYADQFGGPDGKKFGSRGLRSTVLSSVKEGKAELLDTTHDQWKEREEQVDDVTVMLFRV